MQSFLKKIAESMEDSGPIVKHNDLPRRNVLLLGFSGFVGGKLARLFRGDNLVLLDPRHSNQEYSDQLIELQIRASEEDICIVTAAAGVNSSSFSQNDFDFNAFVLPDKVKYLQSLGFSKFVYLGSCFEYGLTGNRSVALSVTSLLEPAEEYGKSKKDGYLRVMDWASSTEVSLSYLRLFQVFGEGEASHRLYSGLVQAGKQNLDYLLKDPYAVRDFCEINSVVEAINDHSYKISGLSTLNVCTGKPTTLLEFSSKILMSMKSLSKLEIATPAQEGIYRTLVGVPDITLPVMR